MDLLSVPQMGHCNLAKGLPLLAEWPHNAQCDDADIVVHRQRALQQSLRAMSARSRTASPLTCGGHVADVSA